MHADLKAENLLLDNADSNGKVRKTLDLSRVVLADFGSAKKITDSMTDKADPKKGNCFLIVYTESIDTNESVAYDFSP